MYSLKDKIVVITGASSGIGRALAIEAYNRGAKISVCARNLDKLKEAIAIQSDNVLYHQVDVSKETDCELFINTTLSKFNHIDVLINNAGISMRALFEDADIKVIKELMDINFWGSVFCTKYAITSIREHKGVIASISSIAGFRGLPARTGYSASKFALQGFMEGLRTELLKTGAHVMWVCPGFTSSNIRNVARSADGNAQGETPLSEDKLMTAEECARITIDGIEKRKRTIVMTSQGKLTVLLNKLLPGLADKLVFNHFLRESNSPLKKYNMS
ncbi:MAG: SDR family oxidoreductase [Bacteroidetes bacterium]|nr:SDR family oxidoreductase [Bacteroidota bacterium]